MRVDMTFHRTGPSFTQIGDKASAMLDIAVRKSTLSVERRAKVAIQTGAKTGTVYRVQSGFKRSSSGGSVQYVRSYKSHQASAPGEAPATDTGNLVNSISNRHVKLWEGEVRVSADYSYVLEFGGVHMAPRPFMAPAVADEFPEFVGACNSAMRQAAS